MDMISELPEFIVHHILSFLNSPTELVRMSVLSKTWFHLTASFPVLYFHDDDFTLKLVATLEEPAELDIVNRCVELALNKGLYELEIEIIITNSSSAYAEYRLPNTLLSASVLESLTIRGCELPSSLMLDDAVKFKSLIELKLENVSIDDEAIKHLTTSCPLLEEFHIVGCDGFKNVCVYGHQNLQIVWIDYNTKNGFEVLNLYIQATYSQKFIDLEKLKTVTLPPYELEHVELQLDTQKEPSDYVAFVEASSKKKQDNGTVKGKQIWRFSDSLDLGIHQLRRGDIYTTDRISELPDFIAHHILSYLNTPTELVRMSVLSKTWFHLTASFPILYFYDDYFTSRETFFKYVFYTSSRFCHQDIVTADEFMLVTTIQEPGELNVVNRCLELLLDKGMGALAIKITYNLLKSPIPNYRLPNTLLSVSMLYALVVCGYELPSSLMLDVVQFKSLIHLELERVHIDNDMIKYLTTSCPLLEKLVIRDCDGFKRFCVYGHQNLHTVEVVYNTPVDTIDIETPNLSSLMVGDKGLTGAPRMNLASCKKLTTFIYIGHPLPNSNGFTNFLSNFPFIECLLFGTTYKCSNLKISSHSLRTLVVYFPICDLEEIELNTPNLVFFSYPCKPRFFSPKVRHLTHLKGCMQCYLDDSINTLWFKNLSQFLGKKTEFKVLNLYIHAESCPIFIELEELKAIELAPYELEHVELHLDTHDDSIALVKAVLWCCRPRSLTLRSSFPLEEQSVVVKFTYEKLLEQEDQGHTNIHIVSPSSCEAQKHLRDLKSLSVALPRDRKAISFIKEQGGDNVSADGSGRDVVGGGDVSGSSNGGCWRGGRVGGNTMWVVLVCVDPI
ncbi:uncharacterized protein LOC143592145 [Bidens hawaiensis]|uniref:uncharacterized protein LOC143592145 n=1 Tax=Bidens hawaiensis TaxID=980011 RepID=UPI004049CF3E